MAYSFLTITSLKSSLKFKKITISLYFAAERIYNIAFKLNNNIDLVFDSLPEFMKH